MNKICESEQLPCSLQKFQSQMEGMDWMTSNDVGRWCTEQSKDLVSISALRMIMLKVSYALHGQFIEQEIIALDTIFCNVLSTFH